MAGGSGWHQSFWYVGTEWNAVKVCKFPWVLVNMKKYVTSIKIQHDFDSNSGRIL